MLTISTIEDPAEYASLLEEYDQALGVIERHRAAHAQPMLTANVFLRRACTSLGIDGQVTQRLKRMETIRDKLLREPGELDRMQDLGGCRVVVPALSDVYRLKDHIFARLERRCVDVRRYSDYIETPRETGYRAIHIVAPFGVAVSKPVEIQIRTRAMHEWANMVEEVSGILGRNYKRDGDGAFHDWARTASQILALKETDHHVPEELFEQYHQEEQRLFAGLERRQHG
jgi:ppGpp synthetase/RelA/SpoT-type nucleotidyltranferase